MDGLSSQQIISGLVTVLIMSYAAFFVWIAASIRELRNEIRELRDELRSRIDRLDEKFSNKLEWLTIAVSPLEGVVYHAPPSAVPQPLT
jgi:hypothetical protein